MLFLNKGILAYIYSSTPIILGRHTEAFILLETVDLWKDQILKASLGDSWVYICPLECFLEKIFLMIILKPFMADTYPQTPVTNVCTLPYVVSLIANSF